MGFSALVSPNRCSPAPSTTGKIFSRISSTRSCSISVRTSWKLPATMTSPFSSCFSLKTSSTALPVRTVELFQWASSSVDDTTYLGRLFNLTANWPLRDGRRPFRRPAAVDPHQPSHVHRRDRRDVRRPTDPLRRCRRARLPESLRPLVNQHQASPPGGHLESSSTMESLLRELFRRCDESLDAFFYRQLVGMRMNEDELAANPRLDPYHVQDLNRETLLAWRTNQKSLRRCARGEAARRCSPVAPRPGDLCWLLATDWAWSAPESSSPIQLRTFRQVHRRDATCIS